MLQIPGTLIEGGRMNNRLMRVSLAAVLACHGIAHAQDGEVRPLDLRFETLRPGALALDPRNGLRADAAGYSTVTDPLRAEVSSGLYRPVSDRLTTLLESTHAQGIGLTTEWSMLGQLGASFGEGWELSAGLRHSELGLRQPLGEMPHTLTGYADLGMLSVERSWRAYKGSYTFYAGRSDDGASASGHRFQLHYFYGDSNSVGLSYTLGPTLGLGTRLIEESESRNMGITGQHWLTPRWALNYDALVEDYGDGDLKPELRLGVRMRF